MRGSRTGTIGRARQLLTVTAVVVASTPVLGAPAQAANPSANLDQCENGKASAPKNCDWGNGNLNENNSHYGEGDSVPYRVKFSNLTTSPATHTVTIEWDTTKSGKHAFDYLTTYNRTQAGDPCAGVTPCANPSTAPIPADTSLTPANGFSGTQIPGNFTLWNGTIVSTGTYTRTGSAAGDGSTRITITFTAATANPVLAWSGHVGTRLDWGVSGSASSISGSPYHMRLLDLDGSGGNQDMSMSAESVVFPSSITIVKQATPEGSRQFSFNGSDGLGAFTLVDDGLDNVTPHNFKKFSGLTGFYDNTTKNTYDFTETVPTGWELSSITCGTGAVYTADPATGALSIKLAEGTDVVCTYTNNDILPTITVGKVPTPSSVMEPSGAVSFAVSVRNNSAVEPVTLTTLSDSVYGNIASATNAALTSTTCAVPQVITAGSTYNCAFVANVTGNAGATHANTVTATVTDAEANNITGTASATVPITNRMPAVSVTKTPSPTTVTEPGANVTFTIRTTNGTAEAVSLYELNDSVFGNIASASNAALVSTTCAVPQSLAGSASYSCSFTALVSGNAGATHNNTITARVRDDETNTASNTASAAVTVTDRLPSITVTKTPTPASVPEPGGNVSFAVQVANGTAEAVTLYELNDSVFGNLLSATNAAVSSNTCPAAPTAIPGSGTYSCSFTAFISGDAGATHNNTVTARVRDDETNTTSNTGSASVPVTNVAPAVSVTKTPRQASVAEPGADVAFDLVVTNNSVEPVTLYELTDSVYGNVADGSNSKLVSTTCAVPATLAKPGSYSCAFTAFVAGNGATTHTNTVTARVRDNENGTASNTGSANVSVTDAPPRVAVTKTPSKTTVAVGTPVTYTYKVTNPGVEPLVVVTVTDDKCSPVTRTGGDTDSDGHLDPGEEWIYTCTTTLTGTTVNTVSVVAEDDEGTGVLETATARVEVTNPRIAIDKSADPQSASPGQTVTYTYVVTNPGDGPLTDVRVTDDKCSPVSFVGGDADGDTVLDQGETWTYRCAQVVGSSGDSLTNIGTVTAKDATGATVSADDTETIAIVLGVTFERSAPTVLGVDLPRTGAALAGWAATGTGFVAAGAGLLLAGRRRRRSAR